MLKLQYRDDVLKETSPEREYKIVSNEKGNSVLHDVSEYAQTGDDFGAAQMKEIARSLYDFKADSVIFNPDGSITENLEIGTKTTTFNNDGSITETLVDIEGNKITKQTTFNDDGSIVSVVGNVESSNTEEEE